MARALIQTVTLTATVGVVGCAMAQQPSAAGERSPWVRFLGPRVHQWLEDLDEVVEGKGDGVVSVKRGRLEGVDDTVVLKFGHARVLRTPAHGDVNRAHQELLRRLKDRDAKSSARPQAAGRVGGLCGSLGPPATREPRGLSPRGVAPG